MIKLRTWTRFSVDTNLPDGFRDTYGDALTANAIAPFPPRSMSGGQRVGWCRADDLLGVDFGDINGWLFNQYAVFALRVDTKKIPAAVFRAHFEDAKRTWCRENKRERCPVSVREELRETLVAKLMPDVMPALRSIPVVWNVADGYVLVASQAMGAVDAARKLFHRTFGLTLREWVPAVELEGDAITALAGGSIVDDPTMPPQTMGEFFRWLWEQDKRGAGEIDVEGSTLQWWVDDLVKFSDTPGGAVTSSMRPHNTAVPALLASVAYGDTLAALRVVLRRDDREYVVTLTPSLHPVGAKMPVQVKTGDAGERLYDVMFVAEELHYLIASLWRTFAEIRTSSRWGQANGSARAWLNGELVRVFEVDDVTGQCRLFSRAD